MIVLGFLDLDFEINFLDDLIDIEEVGCEFKEVPLEDCDLVDVTGSLDEFGECIEVLDHALEVGFIDLLHEGAEQFNEVLDEVVVVEVMLLEMHVLLEDGVVTLGEELEHPQDVCELIGLTLELEEFDWVIDFLLTE